MSGVDERSLIVWLMLVLMVSCAWFNFSEVAWRLDGP